MSLEHNNVLHPARNTAVGRMKEQDLDSDSCYRETVMFYDPLDKNSTLFLAVETADMATRLQQTQ